MQNKEIVETIEEQIGRQHRTNDYSTFETALRTPRKIEEEIHSGYELRPWQRDCADMVHAYFKESPNNFAFFVEAATGTGKSVVAGLFADTLPGKGVRAIVVMRGDIVKQHATSLCLAAGFVENETLQKKLSGGEIFALTSPSGKKILVTTVQALANIASKRLVKGIDVLIADEGHLFLSGANDTFISAIRGNLKPKRQVIISATMRVNLANVRNVCGAEAHYISQTDADLLGKLPNRFSYDALQAMQDGILTDKVEIHYVDTGTESQIAEVAEFEAAIGMSVTDYQGLSLARQEEILESAEIDATTLSTTNNDDHASRCADNATLILRSNTMDQRVDQIIQSRFRAMIDLYAAKYGATGDRAIFYLPSIAAARLAYDYYVSRNDVIGSSECINSEDGGTDEAIARFRSGETRVIFCCQMLREGFDLPELKYVFDCNFYSKWDAGRVATIVQKIGRIVRKHASKTAGSPAIYHAALSVDAYYDCPRAKAAAKLTDQIKIVAKGGGEKTVSVSQTDDAEEEQVVVTMFEGVVDCCGVGTGDTGSDLVEVSTDGDIGGGESATRTPGKETTVPPGLKNTPKQKTQSVFKTVMFDITANAVVRETVTYQDVFGGFEDPLARITRICAADAPPLPKTTDYQFYIGLFRTLFKTRYREAFKRLNELRPEWVENFLATTLDRIRRICAADTPPKQKEGADYHFYNKQFKNRDGEEFKLLNELRPEWVATFRSRVKQAAEPAFDRVRRLCAADAPPAKKHNIPDYEFYHNLFRKWRDSEEFNLLNELRPEWVKHHDAKGLPDLDRIRRICAADTPPKTREGVDYEFYNKHLKKRDGEEFKLLNELRPEWVARFDANLNRTNGPREPVFDRVRRLCAADATPKLAVARGDYQFYMSLFGKRDSEEFKILNELRPEWVAQFDAKKRPDLDRIRRICAANTPPKTKNGVDYHPDYHFYNKQFKNRDGEGFRLLNELRPEWVAQFDARRVAQFDARRRRNRD